jgi:hypothetical protein
MELKKLLKILSNYGYPSDSTLTIMSSVGYDQYEFLGELVNEFGEEKTYEFVRKTLQKLSSGIHSDINIKIPLDNNVNKGSWIYLIIHKFEINLEEESSDVLITNYSWGDNKIIDEDGNSTTLEEIFDKVDMGEWSEYEDFIDIIRNSCYDFIQKNCGFGIWFN